MEIKGGSPDGSGGGAPDREEWLKGPVTGIPALLQPAAHALLQVRKELDALMKGFPDELLWERPGGAASAGFHLQHLTGVLDRLFTYAKGEALSAAQLRALKGEGAAPSEDGPGQPGGGVVRQDGAGQMGDGTARSLKGDGAAVGSLTSRLVASFDRQVDLALGQLAATDPDTLTEPRGVGRAGIPSTVLGLLFHATEHTTRHFGQLLVTVKVLCPR